MTLNIAPAADDIRDSFQRVYARVDAAGDEGVDQIEITQQEAYDLFNRQPIFDDHGKQIGRGGVDMSAIKVGMRGQVIGFPCVIVERLGEDTK